MKKEVLLCLTNFFYFYKSVFYSPVENEVYKIKNKNILNMNKICGYYHEENSTYDIFYNGKYLGLFDFKKNYRLKIFPKGTIIHFACTRDILYKAFSTLFNKNNVKDRYKFLINNIIFEDYKKEKECGTKKYKRV